MDLQLPATRLLTMGRVIPNHSRSTKKLHEIEQLQKLLDSSPHKWEMTHRLFSTPQIDTSAALSGDEHDGIRCESCLEGFCWVAVERAAKDGRKLPSSFWECKNTPPEDGVGTLHCF